MSTSVIISHALPALAFAAGYALAAWNERRWNAADAAAADAADAARPATEPATEPVIELHRDPESGVWS